MKRFIIIMLMIGSLVLAMTACTASNSDSESTASDETSSQSTSEESSQATTVEVKDSDTDISEASISQGDACDMVEALTMEQLGLEGEKEDYKFMISTVGKTIDGNDYLQVLASSVTEENEDGTINMLTMGTYYVSYDGEHIYVIDSETGELTEIE